MNGVFRRQKKKRGQRDIPCLCLMLHIKRNIEGHISNSDALVLIDLILRILFA